MSILKINEMLICPYCNANQNREIEVGASARLQVVRCCTEDGGCEGDFVLSALYRVSLICRKIEGEP